MEDRMNEGYKIIRSMALGDIEFVMGYNARAVQPFVTWQCWNGNDYYWEHYTDSLLKATKDLCERMLEEVEYQEALEKKREATKEQKKESNQNFQNNPSGISDAQAWQAYQNYLQQHKGASQPDIKSSTNPQSDFEK